jgi:Protein of unknown function (DUF4235)
MIGTIAWKALRGTTVVLATMAAERGLEASWTVVTGRKPPAVPENPDSSWGKSLAWAMVSGAVVGATRLAATRAAAAYYERSAGRLPKTIRSK